MSRWTVLFSSVIPASGTRQIDKTFIKGLLTIQDQEHFKTHNKRKLRQQYRKSRFSGDKTAPLAVSFHHAWAAILDVFENFRSRPESETRSWYSSLSFWTVWFRHNRRWVDTWARDTVRWHWSADALFWQLSTDHNIDVQSVFSWAPKEVRKCESKHWFFCGADGRSMGRAVGLSVYGHVIIKFSGMGWFT